MNEGVEKRMMHVVIRTGGKQYRLAEGDQLRVEKLAGEIGQEVVLSDVLMAETDGQILLDPAALAQFQVRAKIVRHGRGRKVRFIKFRRRKGYQRKGGHRQDFTEIRVGSISRPPGDGQ